MPRVRPGTLNLGYARLTQIEQEAVLATVRDARNDMRLEHPGGEFTQLATWLTGAILSSGTKHTTTDQVDRTIKTALGAELRASHIPTLVS